MDRLWDRTLNVLKDSVDSKSFNTWLKPLAQIQANTIYLQLAAPNKTVRKWFMDKYLAQANAVLREVAGREMTIEVVLRNEQMSFDALLPQKPTAAETNRTAPGNGNGNNNPSSETYTFERFVVGPSNEFAYAACKNVAKNPGRGMNPLFIYGGTGLGKTHLLNAVASQMLKRDPERRLIVVSAERFMNELISAIQGKRTSAFHKKYRNLDALLIDDIQPIAGKHATQEEFFHTFNALYENDAQIVLASDKYPKDIPMLEERLRSRFGMGMIADIQAPELETRMAIVKKKAAQDNMTLPEEVTFYVAANITDNIRELEGALRRVAAFGELQGGKLTLEIAKRALRNVIGDTDKPITIDQVQRTVCEYYRVKHNDLVGERRHKIIARPRQVAMYLSRKLTGSSLPDIAAKFGGRDHTTVLHAVRKVDELREKDPQLTTILETLEKSLRK